jgi:hypothetical protein
MGGKPGTTDRRPHAAGVSAPLTLGAPMTKLLPQAFVVVSAIDAVHDLPTAVAPR